MTQTQCPDLRRRPLLAFHRTTPSHVRRHHEFQILYSTFCVENVIGSIPRVCGCALNFDPVVCLAAKPVPIYRPRQPRQSPLSKTIERYLPEFERTYDEHYARRYGPWRPIIGDVARRFLHCGDLHYGFARVRCPDCRHEMFVAFSCQQR